MSNNLNGLKRKLGQNTAEYLMMLVLIAGGSIGLFTYFGNTIRAHLGNVVSAFGGNKDAMVAEDKINTMGKEAGTIGGTKHSMQGVNKDQAVPDVKLK
jgi:hypothetical protein